VNQLTACVIAFKKLLDIQYRFIIGRKGRTTKLCIGFSKLDLLSTQLTFLFFLRSKAIPGGIFAVPFFQRNRKTTPKE
jgi:hypothetical protein